MRHVQQSAHREMDLISIWGGFSSNPGLNLNSRLLGRHGEHCFPCIYVGLASVDTHVVKRLYSLYEGWVGVGWQRRCKTRRSLRVLDHQHNDFCLFVGGRHGLRSSYIVCAGWRNLNPGEGEEPCHIVCIRHMVRHP